MLSAMATGEYKQAAVERAREYVLQAKWEGVCEDCGGEYPAAAMDFDHVRGEKRAAVSQLVRYGYSTTAIQAEIDKCELVCANCHRLRTARRRELDPDRVVGELR